MEKDPAVESLYTVTYSCILVYYWYMEGVGLLLLH